MDSKIPLLEFKTSSFWLFSVAVRFLDGNPNCWFSHAKAHLFFSDNGYFSEESYDHLIPTAWIPFLDAKPENGCLQVDYVCFGIGFIPPKQF